MPSSVEQYIHRIGRVGRADAIGLAISLVSKHEEKVWFHTCGRSRAKASTCTNRKLTSEGGCCMWNNELQVMKSVEERSISVPELSNTLDLPPEIDLVGYGIFVSFMCSVRVSKNDKLIQLATKNAETIKHNVDILEKLENQTQNSYLFIKQQFI